MQVPIPILGEKKGVRQRQVIMPCRVLGVKLQRILRPRLEPPQRHFTCEHKEGWFYMLVGAGNFGGGGPFMSLEVARPTPPQSVPWKRSWGAYLHLKGSSENNFNWGLSSTERASREFHLHGENEWRNGSTAVCMNIEDANVWAQHTF